MSLETLKAILYNPSLICDASKYSRIFVIYKQLTILTYPLEKYFLRNLNKATLNLGHYANFWLVFLGRVPQQYSAILRAIQLH